MTDDYASWDPPIWLGVLVLYILPICVNFYGCRKNKRKSIPSFLVSVFYPTAIWIIILIWLYLLVSALTFFDIKTNLNWIGVVLSFALGGVVMFPLGWIWLRIWQFFNNYKEKGIYSFKNIKHKNK